MPLTAPLRVAQRLLLEAAAAVDAVAAGAGAATVVVEAELEGPKARDGGGGSFLRSACAQEGR